MLDGTIVKWLKREGDPVEEGEPIVEVETAKIETELESTATGILVHIMVAEGTNVPVRTLLAIVADPGEDVPRPGSAAPSGQGVAAAPIQDSPLTSSPPQDGDRVPVVPAARRLAQERRVDLGQVRGTGPKGRILIVDVERAIETAQSATAVAPPAKGPPGVGVASQQKVQVQVVPAARRLAREKGIDLTQVPGSGPGGRILVTDINQAVQTPVPAVSPTAPQTMPMEGMRRTIATRMLQSLQTMAQVTLTT